MKINNICKILLSLSFVGLASTSCVDLLDTDTSGVIKEEDFYKNRNDLNAAAMAMYAPLAEMPHQFLLWGSARADLVTSASSDVNVNEFVLNKVSEKNPYLDYSNLYKTIVRANRQMQHVNDVVKFDTNVREYDAKMFYAEALGLRAMCYYYLVRTFKSFPLILTDPTESLPDYRGEGMIEKPFENLTTEELQKVIDNMCQNFDREKVWEQIYKDASTAYELMSRGYQWNEGQSNGAMNIFRLSKNSISALLSEVALWRGDYVTAVGVAEVYSRITDNKTGGSKDTWVNQYTNAYSEGHSLFSLGYKFTTTRKVNRLQEFTSPVEKDGGKYLLKPVMDRMEELFETDEVLTVKDNYYVFEAKDDVRSKFSYKQTVNGKDVIWKYIGLSEDNTSMRSSYKSDASWHFYKASGILFSYMLGKRQLALNGDQMANLSVISVLNNVREARGCKKVDYKNLGLSDRNKDDVNLYKEIIDAHLDQWIEEDMTREMVFEGQRWYQLMLLSKLKGENVLAPAVASKYPVEMRDQVLQNLSDEENWYLPRPRF